MVNSTPRLARITVAALFAGVVLVGAIRFRLPRFMLRRRISRHLDIIHALREHAVAAKALIIPLHAHPERQRVLRDGLLLLGGGLALARCRHVVFAAAAAGREWGGEY